MLYPGSVIRHILDLYQAVPLSHDCSVVSNQGMRTEGHWFDPPLGQCFPRIDDSHCDTYHCWYKRNEHCAE